MEKQEKLVEYLIQKGKEKELSAINYVERGYYNVEDFIDAERRRYFREYYWEHKDKYRDYREKRKFPCVYFLLKDNVVVYVGSTEDISNRIAQHKHINRDFDRVLFKDLSSLIAKEDKRTRLDIEYFYQNIYKNTLENCIVYPLKDNDGLREILEKIWFVPMEEYIEHIKEVLERAN